jgi:signal peptidase I
MFNWFTSSEKKARTSAIHWLEVATTVWNVRNDRLSPSEAAELSRSREALAQLVRDRADVPKLNLAMEELESVLRRTGGAIYPRTALAENVEFFLIAAIVILGIRAYFFQPMVIPTNSMWPSYYGLTAENFPPGTSPPGLISRIARLAAFGAVRKEMDAPEGGMVSAVFFTDLAGQPILDVYGQPLLVPKPVEGRSWLVFPAKQAEYTLYVNDRPVKIEVPEDFHEFDRVLAETYFPTPQAFTDLWNRAKAEGRLERAMIPGGASQSFSVYRMPLGKTVKAGEPVVRFDVMKGEMLVVDRFSYHFIRPKVGTAFVFATGRIPDLVRAGIPDQFYIKRLVGVPGDTLEVKEPVLYRNGAPITGAVAFDLNARREGNYRGYFNSSPGHGQYLFPGQTLTVPPHSFLGFGDNSIDSEDGRYWGFVPDRDVVGRPLFIYYPFTRRWGIPQ